VVSVRQHVGRSAWFIGLDLRKVITQQLLLTSLGPIGTSGHRLLGGTHVRPNESDSQVEDNHALQIAANGTGETSG
jgi:hypothetical protein